MIAQADFLSCPSAPCQPGTFCYSWYELSSFWNCLCPFWWRSSPDLGNAQSCQSWSTKVDHFENFHHLYLLLLYPTKLAGLLKWPIIIGHRMLVVVHFLFWLKFHLWNILSWRPSLVFHKHFSFYSSIDRSDNSALSCNIHYSRQVYSLAPGSMVLGGQCLA